jgi:hypothetical protein
VENSVTCVFVKHRCGHTAYHAVTVDREIDAVEFDRFLRIRRMGLCPSCDFRECRDFFRRYTADLSPSQVQ